MASVADHRAVEITMLGRVVPAILLFSAFSGAQARALCHSELDAAHCFCDAFTFEAPMPWFAIGPVLLNHDGPSGVRDYLRVDQVEINDGSPAAPVIGELIPVAVDVFASKYVAYPEHQGLTESSRILAFPANADGSINRLIPDGFINGHSVEAECMQPVSVTPLIRTLASYTGPGECWTEVHHDLLLPVAPGCPSELHDDGCAAVITAREHSDNILFLLFAFALLRLRRHRFAAVEPSVVACTSAETSPMRPSIDLT